MKTAYVFLDSNKNPVTIEIETDTPIKSIKRVALRGSKEIKMLWIDETVTMTPKQMRELKRMGKYESDHKG
jgi:hypothetical protein